jgi:hypothetical protein
MPNEKLTPWDAPLPNKPAKKKSGDPYLDAMIAQIKQDTAEQHAAMMNGKRWIPGKPIEEYSHRWWKPRNGKKFGLPFNPFSMTEGPLVYVLYGGIVAMQSAIIITSPNENHVITDFSLGVNFGLIVFTFFSRMKDGQQKRELEHAKAWAKREARQELKDEFRRTGKI